MGNSLNKKDTLILWELFQNSRVSISDIAKKVKMPKPTIKYRMDQLIKKGILNKNFVIVDMSRFNFSFYELFIKLQGMPKSRKIQALEKLKKNPYLSWLVETGGRFSIHCAISVRKPTQFYEVYEEIKSLFHPYIKESALNMTMEGKQFNYPFFKDFPQTIRKTKNSERYDEIPRMSKIQLNLLKRLTKNSREPLTEIARKLKTTIKTVRANIKKLEKEKIITSYTCQLHPGLAEYIFYLVTIRIKIPNKKLKEYLEKIPEIFYIVKGAGFYDLKAEFYVDKESRIHEIEQELHQKFGDSILETDIMHVDKEHLIRYFTEA